MTAHDVGTDSADEASVSPAPSTTAAVVSRRKLLGLGLTASGLGISGLGVALLLDEDQGGTSSAMPSPPEGLEAEKAATTYGPRLGQESLGVQAMGEGRLTITEPGAVFEQLIFTGVVVVDAPDVTFRDCRFERGTQRQDLVVQNKSTGLVLEHCEIDGLGDCARAIGFSGFTLRASDIHGCNDGVGLSNDNLVEDSWIHDLARVDDGHPDCIQSTGGQRVIVRRNVLDCRSASSGDLGNSCVQLGNENQRRSADSVLDDYLFENNTMNGGNYTVNVRDDPGVGSIVFRGNRFGRDVRYGQMLVPGSISTEGNSMEDSTAVVIENT